MNWARVLAYVTGTVNQELLLRNEYLAAENRNLRAKIKGRLLLSDAERNSGRDCSPARTKSAERFGGGRETGNLLSWQTHRQQVRRGRENANLGPSTD